MYEYSNIMNKTWLTWYRDDWNILIGHNPWRAALLHIEVSCLEKSPTGTQRELLSGMQHSETTHYQHR